ncbi:MAG: hypothetical protein B6U88_01080, partial [Candidatus Aenigmarchaeota archaeon ex4484_56]
GAGTRLIWYPRKAAFRVGYVSGTQWDDANIGDYSIAMGVNTEASGRSSVAIGWDSIAPGDYSIAIGSGTEAYGFSSVAIGDTTTASGDQSIAMGGNTEASGDYSTAMGHFTTASGDYSTAMGHFTTASGYVSTAVGAYTTASGPYSIAIGQGIEASGDSSIAIALNDQTGTVVSQDNTMAIMGGNVGIGTTSPSEKLEVNGSAKIDGDLNVTGKLTQKYDVDLDGALTVNDNILCSLTILGLSVKDIYNNTITLSRLDFDGDGTADVADCYLLGRMLFIYRTSNYGLFKTENISGPSSGVLIKQQWKVNYV